MMLDRAQGCLLGQLAGDSLGSLVEFKSPEAIRRLYPDGVRDLADGGAWDTLAGQPTDDSELALMLARTLVARGAFDIEAVRGAYVSWFESGPFDCGATTANGLLDLPDMESQANGALMRVSPLGIFGANYELSQVRVWARQDASITHPNPVCLDANALYAMAIAHAVKTGPDPQDLYQSILEWAAHMELQPGVSRAVRGAASNPPPEYVRQQGWVLIAFWNALWQLLHASSFEEAVIDTVMRGGDTDTNAAICGALLGAVYGRAEVPERWVQRLLNCRPEAGQPGVYRPRPKCFWPVDALDLAGRLIAHGPGQP